MKILARHKRPPTIKSADLNRTLGLVITHDVVESTKSDEYQ
jgi:hypothetical protein